MPRTVGIDGYGDVEGQTDYDWTRLGLLKEDWR